MATTEGFHRMRDFSVKSVKVLCKPGQVGYSVTGCPAWGRGIGIGTLVGCACVKLVRDLIISVAFRTKTGELKRYKMTHKICLK